MFFTLTSFSQTKAIVLAVHDGDSYKVKTQDTTMWVRLIGVDCPEVISNYVVANQDFGVETAVHIRQMLKGDTVTIDSVGTDIYNRQLTRVTFDSIDMTHYLVANGYGWYYYSQKMPLKERNQLKALQKEAQKNKLGLWGMDGEKIKPSDFRKKNKPKKK